MTTLIPLLDRDIQLHQVQAGETLSKIIVRYHGNLQADVLQSLISETMAANPQIKNPDLIYSGQLLQIPIPASYVSTETWSYKPPILKDLQPDYLGPVCRDWNKATPQERSMMPSLIDVSLATASAMAGGADALLNSNKSLISKIAVSYEQYKQGAISKNQYDYIRKQSIDKLSENMKSTTRLFTGDKSVKEVLRISRTKGTVPTANIKYAASKIGDYGKAAAKGGLVLSAISLADSCKTIATTNSIKDRSIVLVEGLSSTISGIAAGTAVSLILALTPVGWVAAIAIGIAIAAGAYATGKIAGSVYQYMGEGNIADTTGITNVCRNIFEHASKTGIDTNKLLISNNLSSVL
ncbi:LysM peptidoglycan-binding domain-containing protein [Thalassolituus oleivorans]|uniref:LysM peptidoglycan-binding domain-containing protein n=1 Tax=Thalassolituus oleivorans TaxID=187493 RepID=UPI0023F1ABB4|nr:LysM peptidoglycan-binding domain-containing protein [Thalassolituus oleivorans]